MSRFSSRRVEIESRIERQVEVESATLSARSRSSVAIGAIRRGGACSRFVSRRRKELTQCTSGMSPTTLRIAMAMPTIEHADDQPVQAGIGHERARHLAIENERHERRDDQEDDHPDHEDPRTRKHIGVEVASHRPSAPAHLRVNL